MRSVGFTISTSLLAALALVPAAAHGHGATAHAAKDPFKAAAPTKQHAAEHEAVDGLIAKIRTMPAAQRAKLQRKALGTGSSQRATRLADQNVGPASVYGQWTAAPFKAPTYGIHGMLLPTGRVLVMSMGNNHGASRPGSNIGQDVNNDGTAALWDPARGTGTDAFKMIDPPPIPLDDPQRRRGYNKLRAAPVYCSGHVQLADGRV
ncbi:MAG: hypothetical protein JHD16_10765, partial [Solirubrobacteraceae bacterium]|nr:hypothetical protein [Solirubrobacteraceae bacterium]